MELISAEDIYEVAELKKMGFLGKPIAQLLKHIFSLSEINNIYSKGENISDVDEFLEYLVKEIQIKYEIHEEDLKRIPEEGAFAIVSNHPLGGLDGILMMHLIHKIRPDFKIMGNFLLQKIKPLSPIVIPVNPFETRPDIYSSVSGMKLAFKHLKEGNSLGIFPAGEVSNKNEGKEILDKEWQMPIMKLLKKAEIPVIPMYFRAKNSPLFYRAAKIHPSLQTVLLPKEMLRERRRPVQIRIGKSILPKQQKDYENIEEYSDFLRKKTYSLSTFYNKQKSYLSIQPKFSQISGIQKSPKEIVEETPAELIKNEFNNLRNSADALLFTNNNYECFFAKASEIPYTLREIGRLREITFREVGEGTDNEIDLDKYDEHYQHLFLYDKDAKKIVGAYRMALGKDVYKTHGISGFYLTELFNFEPEMHKYFQEGIEMGRAFVVKEYQQKPMPLFLLWRGIMHVALRNPEHKYILGGVSISNQFSDFSKSLMIEFMKSHYYDPYVAQFVRAKKEFKIKLKDEDKEFFFDEAEADLNKFDKLIDEVEPNALRIPVLIKKYIKQNARVVGFNVDPLFNNAVDGLMYIRISDIPESTIRPVMEELQKELEKGD